MDIVVIDLSKLRNEEYLQYMSDYLHFYEANDPVAIGVADEVNALKALLEAIELVFTQDYASPLTKLIARLDNMRARYLLGIATVIKGYLEHYDENKVEMAGRLHRRIFVHGKSGYEIGRLSLQGETATLRSLTNDFQNDPILSGALAALGLTDWVATLKTTNDNLDQAYKERADKKGDMPEEKIKDLRIEANKLYYALREMMRSHAHIAGYAAPFGALIADLNALTEMYNQTLAQRSGGGEGW